jgi:hypothetical protein
MPGDRLDLPAAACERVNLRIVLPDNIPNGSLQVAALNTATLEGPPTEPRRRQLAPPLPGQPWGISMIRSGEHYVTAANSTCRYDGSRV